jgi:hypothetical protein
MIGGWDQDGNFLKAARNRPVTGNLLSSEYRPADLDPDILRNIGLEYLHPICFRVCAMDW